MTLTIRKIIVFGLVGAIFLVSNVLLVAHWLSEKGIVDWARNIRTEYLTGTAITIIAVLLILLVSPRGQTGSLVRRCPVCDSESFQSRSIYRQPVEQLLWNCRLKPSAENSLALGRQISDSLQELLPTMQERVALFCTLGGG